MKTSHIKRHAILVDRMADARGLDLQEAALRGDITPSEISDLVLRCTGCTQTATCERWLDEQVGAVSAAPHYCRNAHEFSALAANRSG